MGENKKTQNRGRRSRAGTSGGSGNSLREFSSGGVVVSGTKFLIRATNPSTLYPKVYWMLPKGWVDNDAPDVPGPMASGKVKATEDALRATAIREVAEETGVNAQIIKKIGSSKYSYNHPIRGKIFKVATFYLMEYVNDLDVGHDDETSKVEWLEFDEAYKKLSFKGEKEILNKARQLLSI